MHPASFLEVVEPAKDVSIDNAAISEKYYNLAREYSTRPQGRQFVFCAYRTLCAFTYAVWVCHMTV